MGLRTRVLFEIVRRSSGRKAKDGDVEMEYPGEVSIEEAHAHAMIAALSRLGYVVRMRSREVVNTEGAE